VQQEKGFAITKVFLYKWFTIWEKLFLPKKITAATSTPEVFRQIIEAVWKYYFSQGAVTADRITFTIFQGD